MAHTTPKSQAYEAVETGYDPGQLATFDGASSTPSPEPSKVGARSKNASHHDYKPTALRWWFHGVLIVCLAVFIGMTEYSIRMLQTRHEDEIAPQLWSRDDSVSHRDNGIKLKYTHPCGFYFPPGFGHKLGQPSGCPLLTDEGSNPAASYLQVTEITIMIPATKRFHAEERTVASPASLAITTTDLTTDSSNYSNTGTTTTTSRDPPTSTAISLSADSTRYLKGGKTTITSTGSPASTAISLSADSTRYLNGGKTTITSIGSPETSTTDTANYIAKGKSTITSKISLVSSIDPTKYLNDGKATITSEISLASSTDPSKILNDGKATITSTGPPATTTTNPTNYFDEGKPTTISPNGQTIVQTVETISPGGTGFIQSFVPVPSGETIVTVPAVVPTTVGGSTEVVQMSSLDSQGHMVTYLYTSILGGTPTLTTHSYVVATSVPSGYALTTISQVLSTTIGGSTEVIDIIVTNPQGQLTTSSYTTVLDGTPTAATEWAVVPIATAMGSTGGSSNSSDSDGNIQVIVYGIDPKEYIIGTFLPTILAVLVTFPIKLISINARLMQPFNTLATADPAHGAAPALSIFLRFDAWFGALSLPYAIRRRQPVVAISDLLVYGAALLTPLASEAVSVHVPNGCQSRCLGSLGVSVAVGRALEALMATMAALLVALVVVVSVLRWRTGVSQNPWSLAGMAGLCLNSKLRDVLRYIPWGSSGSVDDSTILEYLDENKYALGEFWDAPKNPEATKSMEYGLIAVGQDVVVNQLPAREDSDGHEVGEAEAEYKATQSFVLLTWWARCLLMLVLACILTILAYYENSSGDTGFERFMDSQGFGVKFFFTALGVVVGSCVEMLFRSVAVVSPYLQLSKGPLPAERSILLSPPTNAFYGIYSAIRQRHPFLAILSLTTILGELFLPVTLSHVPFSITETYKTQLICTWLSIAILALIILVLAASFFTTWPHLPVDPRTVAGAMSYVCDSCMLGTLQGVSTMSKQDRDLDLKHLRVKYRYGNISKAVNGKKRMGVDVFDDTGEAALLLRNEKTRFG